MFTDLQCLTPHAWVHPPSPDPAEVQSAVGIVVGEDETLLVDAGNSPELARHIWEQLERVGRAGHAPHVGVDAPRTGSV